MKVIRHNEDNDIAGTVKAVKVELTTRVPGERPSTSRFWRLEGKAAGDCWQVALHADKDHQLRLAKESDEQGLTLQDGAAYAFFPLNAVSWPLRFHLHLSLPTNLARDNWNPDDREQVETQLRQAMSGLGMWLEQDTGRWHPQWRLPLLLARKPNANERWAWLVCRHLHSEVRARKLMRTVWGNAVSAEDARTVRLIARDAARTSWSRFCGLLTGVVAAFPIIDTTGMVDFELAELPDSSLRSFFLEVAAQIRDDAGRRALVIALFSVESAEPETLERVATQIEVPCRDGTSSQLLSQLMEQPSGADLPDEWHEVFKTLRNWLWELPHGLTAIFDRQLRFQLQKLSERVFNPPWECVPAALGNSADWVNSGTKFWDTERDICPLGCRKAVVQSLRVQDGTNVWWPISSVWLDSDSSVECFHGVVEKWTPWVAGHYGAQRKIRERLRAWGLWEEWENAVETRLRENLAQRLELAQHAEQQARSRAGTIWLQQPFEAVLQGAHANSRNQLSTRWKAVVRDAEHAAIRFFLRTQRGDLTGARLLAPDLNRELASLLAATSMFTPAPRWLTPFAIECIRSAGEGELLESFSLLRNSDLTEPRRREVAALLLAEFHRWRGIRLSEQQVQAFQQLCESTPATERRNWKVGITSRTALLVRDLFNPDSIPYAPATAIATEDTPDDNELNRELMQMEGIRWIQSEHLPDLLRRVPAVAGASLDASRFLAEVTAGSSAIPAREADVSPETVHNPLFRSLVHQCQNRIVRCSPPLSVRWLNGETIVAELRDAPFAVLDGHVITTRVLSTLDDRQFTEVLSLYARSTRGGPGFDEFQRAWKSGDVPHARLYADHRKAVVPTLLKTQVTDQGYREHHVVRELLQNAESAYDSRPGETSPRCEFSFVLSPPAGRGAWEAVASHNGRHFNEPVWDRRLNKTEERDDIRLIVSTPGSEAPPTEGWIGRFNRGFKSLFTVTGTVEVVSGPYRFAIHDILLLDPANPEPRAVPQSAQTRFSFRCTKTNALKLLRLELSDKHQRSLPIFDPSSFVFLLRVNHIHVQADRWTWDWAVSRKPHASGWTLVTVEQTFPQCTERFLVQRGEVGGPMVRRFGVALRLGAEDESVLPTRLDAGWHKIRLTFPTENDHFPLDFLVDGDFETETGRLGIRNNAANESLLAACLKSVRELCESIVTRAVDLQCWLAWADTMHLARGDEELSQRFEHHNLLLREFQAASEFLCGRIPHGGEIVPVEDLTFPTTLVRRLETFVVLWGFPVRNWIAKEVESRLPRKVRENHSKQSLDGLLAPLPREVLERILADFSRPEFVSATNQLAGPEIDELERARRLFARRPGPPIPEPWTVAQLCREWRNCGQPVDEYTLDGVNWSVLFPEDHTPEADRATRLKGLLQQPQTEPGKHAWYKVLGLACLMSGAGHGRMASLRRFWAEELEAAGRSFWGTTGGHDFSETTKTLFGELALRQAEPNARGEWADYWRHVFYDVRKVHELVWNRDFADTVLRLATDPIHSAALPQFLRDGRIAGQERWAGVLGQSAGAPLFFVVRELCRLGVIPAELLKQVRPLAFFVCTPVRRAAARIGWIDAALANRSDFSSLAKISETLHGTISRDEQDGSELLRFYDIPLLHLGLED